MVTNLGTIAVGAILLAIVVAIIAYLRKQSRSGASSCGGGCSGCAMSGMCHATRQVKAKES